MDDRGEVEAAFAKIVPRDDAERERLARMKQRMLKSHEDMAAEIERAQSHIGVDALEDVRPIVRERLQITRQIKRELLSSFDEQTNLILKIAQRARGSR